MSEHPGVAVVPAPQRWEKIGRVPIEDDDPFWIDDYASVPFLEHVEGSHHWLYFSARDARQRSHTRRALIDLDDPLRPITPEPGHVLGPTRPGFFDADGAMATDLVVIDGVRHLFYIGWNRGADVPFRNAIGLALADTGGRFARHGDGPILDRSQADPCFVASNCVLPDRGGYRMWYLSCVDWRQLDDGSWKHWYHIKDARSEDGRRWEPTGNVAIDFVHRGEHAISMPRVHRQAPQSTALEMWYSNRAGPIADTYRIGYATSDDGDEWTRHDESVQLDVSAAGWDSDMICYPYLLTHAGEQLLFYNGNGYGRTGVGIARRVAP